ncbi:uncharacterized protein [Palaemon carinicauda]|uniref:uncharacterized protein isoform X2 n=1 Tax=Palaemon carinicauda TaxID=392227 RepID=UPI0035B63813
MTTEIGKNSGTEDGKGSTEGENIASSGSDREANKSTEDTDGSARERRTSARILKLKEKHEQEKLVSVSPPPKRRRKYGSGVRNKGGLDRDEDDSQDVIEVGRSSSVGKSAPGEFGSKRNSNLEDGINGSTSSVGKAYLHNPKTSFQIKKLVKLGREGKLEVETIIEEHEDNGDAYVVPTRYKNIESPVKVTRTYPGPLRRPNTITKTDGRKYMILDKATIQGMMEKGLIQSLGKDGVEQKNVPSAYRAVLPKTGPTVVRRIVNPNFQARPPIALISGKSMGTPLPQDFSPSITTATSVSAKLSSSTVPTNLLSSSVSTASDMASSGLTVQIPTSVTTKNSPIGTNPGVGAHVYMKSPIFGTNLGTEKMQFVTVPSSILNQIQKGGSLYSVINNSSVPTSFRKVKDTSSDSPIVVSAGNRMVSSSENLGNPDKDMSDSGDDDEKKNGYGVPTGRCKILKSMKMYQYVDKSGEGNPATHVQGQPKGGPNIRWVAVPNDPNEPQPNSTPQFIHSSPPSLPAMDPSKANSPENNELGTHKSRGVVERYIRYLKNRHEHLLRRYYVRHFHLIRKIQWLKQKLKKIESRCFTPEQLLRESRKYLSDEHVLFFESQMFLKNKKGKGNRYSRKFMKLMIGLYRLNPSGYKYLRGIFSLPSMKKLEILQGNRIYIEELPLDTREPGSVTIEVTDRVEVKPRLCNPPEPSFEEFICNLGPDFEIEEPSKVINDQEAYDCNLKQDMPDPCAMFGLDFNKEKSEEEGLLRPKFDDGNLICSKPKFEEGSLFDDVEMFENNVMIPDLLESCTLTPTAPASGNVLYVSGNPTLIDDNIDAPWHETWPYL